MEDWKQLNTLTQGEALKNELKGSLFEFLVAQKLASGCLAGFYEQFSEDEIKRLRYYQNWLLEKNKDLYMALPLLAQETVKSISKDESIDSVNIVNILMSSYENSESGESDFIIKTNDQLFPISLKLSKEKSFINTKSGGIGSFLAKYFSEEFFEAAILQEQLLTLVDEAWLSLGNDFYDEIGEVFEGSFCDKWTEKMPVLPGELPDNLKKRLYLYYETINRFIENAFKKFIERDADLFKNCVSRILGFSEPGLKQVVCEADVKKNTCKAYVLALEDYVPVSFLFTSESIIAEKRAFSLELPGHFLQIRVKPMNKFTAKSLKVNCAVRKK